MGAVPPAECIQMHASSSFDTLMLQRRDVRPSRALAVLQPGVLVVTETGCTLDERLASVQIRISRRLPSSPVPSTLQRHDVRLWSALEVP